MNQGNPYGTHRVLEPAGVLPQPALRVAIIRVPPRATSWMASSAV